VRGCVDDVLCNSSRQSERQVTKSTDETQRSQQIGMAYYCLVPSVVDMQYQFLREALRLHKKIRAKQLYC
jgi:hypothetical protein